MDVPRFATSLIRPFCCFLCFVLFGCNIFFDFELPVPSFLLPAFQFFIYYKPATGNRHLATAIINFFCLFYLRHRLFCHLFYHHHLFCHLCGHVFHHHLLSCLF